MRITTLFLVLTATLPAAEPPSLESLRGSFEQSLVSWQALGAQPGVSPADELAARIRLMQDLAAWMGAEQANAESSVAALEQLARKLALPGVEETAAAAARRNASERLAAIQEEAARLRVLAKVGDLLPDPTAFERMDAEIAAAAGRRKRLGPALDSIQDAIARIGWHAWLFERQAHSAGVLSEIYESRQARSRQRAAREQDLLEIGAMVREFQAGRLPEWPLDAGERPLDARKLDRAVKRALQGRK